MGSSEVTRSSTGILWSDYNRITETISVYSHRKLYQISVLLGFPRQPDKITYHWVKSEIIDLIFVDDKLLTKTNAYPFLPFFLCAFWLKLANMIGKAMIN